MSEQYWRLVEQSPDAIFISREFRITFLNPAAVRLCGASAPDELLGRSLLDLVHPDSRSRLSRKHGPVDGRAERAAGRGANLAR